MSISAHTNWADAMLADCEQAQHSIVISALSLHPPRPNRHTPFGRLWRAWEQASARGVKIEFILPAPTRIHPATLQNVSAAQHAATVGMHTRFVPMPNLLHAKSTVIDKNICWVGSGNLTAAAAHYNHELYVRFASPEIAQQITERWDQIAN